MPSKEIKETQVLLVEDNKIIQQLTKRVLTRVGLNVETAANGIEAVEMVKRMNFDVVFMDIQMPGMDGYETTRAIRKLSGFQNLPIISMTADAIGDVRKKYMESGMNDYVAKPVSIEHLHRIFTQWIPSKSWNCFQKSPVPSAILSSFKPLFSKNTV